MQNSDMSCSYEDSRPDNSESIDVVDKWDRRVTAINFNQPNPAPCRINKNSFEFGTDSSNDFVFLEKAHGIKKKYMLKISPRHFTLCKRLERMIIEDHSCYGTFVNGVPIALVPRGKRHQLLEPKDKIAVGSVNGPCFQFDQHVQEFQGDDLPEVISGNFHMLCYLGKGGSSSVYVALDKKELKPCALKMINRNANKSYGINSAAYIIREIDILKSIKHETLVNLRDFHWSSKSLQQVFLVMDYMVEGSLANRIASVKEKDEFLDEGICKLVALQLLLGLDYLHFNKIIHRDVKPDNVLIASWSKDFVRIKLTDFGLAKLSTDQEQTKKVVGTKGFIAPEVLASKLANRDPCTFKADIWSFGATMTVCICNDTIDDMGEKATERWSEISEHASDLIRMALEKNPEDRPRALLLQEHLWLNSPEFERQKRKILGKNSIMPTPQHLDNGSNWFIMTSPNAPGPSTNSVTPFHFP